MAGVQMWSVVLIAGPRAEYCTSHLIGRMIKHEKTVNHTNELFCLRCAMLPVQTKICEPLCAAERRLSRSRRIYQRQYADPIHAEPYAAATRRFGDPHGNGCIRGSGRQRQFQHFADRAGQRGLQQCGYADAEYADPIPATDPYDGRRRLFERLCALPALAAHRQHQLDPGTQWGDHLCEHTRSCERYALLPMEF